MSMVRPQHTCKGRNGQRQRGQPLAAGQVEASHGYLRDVESLHLYVPCRGMHDDMLEAEGKITIFCLASEL